MPAPLLFAKAVRAAIDRKIREWTVGDRRFERNFDYRQGYVDAMLDFHDWLDEVDRQHDA